MPTIIAIESSCDETSAAVICDGEIRSNIIATQSVHETYGGVVPELASRAHQKHIIPVVNTALQKANILKSQLSAIAFTRGPGLLGALLVGSAFAKSTALALDIPLIGVHHLKAHVLAHWIESPKPHFPFLCLIVSGGNTQLVLMKAMDDIRVIGQTQDDAVGEAFDKCAKILGFPYPGGPHIDRCAQLGNPKAFSFPISNVSDYHFSFSGIKTALLYFVQRESQKDPNFVKQHLHDICASLQYTLIKMLSQKVLTAAKKLNVQHVGIAGGVSANSGLRQIMTEMGKTNGWNIYIPDFQYCTDNAGMIAIAAHYQYLKSDFCDLTDSPQPRWPID